MTKLAGHPRILVVEDEFFIADEITTGLIEAGAEVVGPVPTTQQGITLLDSEPGLNMALLDINLGGAMVYAFADELRLRGIPFVFATGYNEAAIPEAYRGVPRIEKPFTAADLLALLATHASSPGRTRN